MAFSVGLLQSIFRERAVSHKLQHAYFTVPFHFGYATPTHAVVRRPPRRKVVCHWCTEEEEEEEVE
jgi:hypothetical protein